MLCIASIGLCLNHRPNDASGFDWRQDDEALLRRFATSDTHSFNAGTRCNVLGLPDCGCAPHQATGFMSYIPEPP
jgi:hypothetical protein